MIRWLKLSGYSASRVTYITYMRGPESLLRSRAAAVDVASSQHHNANQLTLVKLTYNAT